MMPQNSPNIEKWLRLIRAEGVGPKAFKRLLERFGSVDRALGAPVAQLAKIERISDKSAEQIAVSRDKFDVDAELELAEKLGVWLINLEDTRYPTLLKRIYDPPPVLYIKGTLDKSDNLAVAIVGSRRCSIYGREQASRFAHMLTAAGFTIVSGMARGIDTAAHHGALSADGRTIAVQGCGLAKIFPPENEKLFKLISQSGVCISELPLNYEPLSENFPPRNRIIAGLSLATIVVEAANRSGALITANAALEYNREVMAVPGKIDSPLSKGSHRLLKQGARLIESVEDIMEALGYIGQQLKEHTINAEQHAEQKFQIKTVPVTKLKLAHNEQHVYGYLGNEPLHIEQVIAAAGRPAGQVNSALVSLQLKGLVKQLPGSFFKKR